MSNSVKKPAPEVVKQYVSFEKRPVPDKHRHSRRAKGPFAKLLAYTLRTAVVAFAGFCGVVAVNLQDEVGYTGVISAKANGIPLSCGGEYDAKTVVVLHPSLPCGTQLQVFNPENGRKVIARVVSNDVMFRKENGRNVDISEGLANLLDISVDAVVPSLTVLRPNAGYARYIPMLAQYQRDAPDVPQANLKERNALTMNMLGECHICGTNGMIAVSQVTLNRWEQRFNGKKTIEKVVFDKSQFSWTLANSALWPNKSAWGWTKGFVLAGAMMTDQTSGDLLAVQYLVTKDATYYYAFDVIATPYWGKRGGKLEVVPMSNTVEVELRHRFFREKDAIKPLEENGTVVLAAHKQSLPLKGPVPKKRPKVTNSDPVANVILANN